jgi:hypothetical protein
MNKYCAYLNIPFPLFKGHVDSFQLPKIKHFKLDKDEFINDELINWFTFLKLEIYLIEVFYSPPNVIGVIHIDSVGGDYTKLNWQFGGKDSIMNWYSETTPNARKKRITSIGSNSITFDTDNVTKVHHQAIQNPSLIQVGVPHNIENFSEDRWVVSVVYKYPIDNYIIRPTWKRSLSLFNEYLIQ